LVDTPLMTIKDLSVQYRSRYGTVRALNGLSAEIPKRGYTLGVVGESGSGKTTLGLAMMNVIEFPGKISAGQIEYDGRNILEMSQSELCKYQWREISIVYQAAMNSLNPVKKVSDPIIEVLRKHLSMSKKEANEQALKLITEVGLDEAWVDSYPHELSGGMRQRIIIALAMALSPKILIADEPTSALDVVVQAQILSLLKQQVLKKDLSLVFITHEIAVLGGLVDNVAVMYAGEIVEQGSLNEIFFQPLHPYTELLLESSQKMQNSGASFSGYTEVNLTTNLSPASCPFSARCKYAFERCRKEKPLLRGIEKGRLVACHKYN
jgi:oligopeptide/dipeptide ABC transporter ATP-binding protein